ncbi:hypothetical protein CFBP2533_29180 [Xanthomonas hortorum pv. pelargonii]|uniref:Uncharacterized protein n=1 Tax=Xanthomonas hortorum pv. pelargonii TaxID=453602 RepID=A0A6V7DYX6_9XANT|nr:hypothetical protein CFBP2533_29180 [Xanthomonas hortorum pv. pelargonii]CAD0343348.1 hypothetical protein CFBP2533_29180 [Xanthomonas hortorum pv. pelargonii]
MPRAGLHTTQPAPRHVFTCGMPMLLRDAGIAKLH